MNEALPSHNHLVPASNSQLENVNLSVKSLQHELKCCRKLLDVTQQTLKKVQEEAEASKKVIKRLVWTVQEQNSILSKNNIACVTPGDLSPVVDPLGTMITIQRLRERLADELDTREAYEQDQNLLVNDVLQLQRYKFALEASEKESEKLKEQLEEATSNSGASERHMFQRLIEELRKDLSLERKLSRSLQFKLEKQLDLRSVIPSLKPDWMTSFMHNLKVDPSNKSHDERPNLLEEHIQALKKELGASRHQIAQLYIELERRTKESDELRDSLRTGEDVKFEQIATGIEKKAAGANFSVRMDELTSRAEILRVRKENSSLTARIGDLEQKLSLSEEEKMEINKTLESSNKRIRSLQSMLDVVRDHLPTQTYGDVNIRDGGWQTPGDVNARDEGRQTSGDVNVRHGGRHTDDRAANERRMKDRDFSSRSGFGQFAGLPVYRGYKDTPSMGATGPSSLRFPADMRRQAIGYGAAAPLSMRELPTTSGAVSAPNSLALTGDAMISLRRSGAPQLRSRGPEHRTISAPTSTERDALICPVCSQRFPPDDERNFMLHIDMCLS